MGCVGDGLIHYFQIMSSRMSSDIEFAYVLCGVISELVSIAAGGVVGGGGG